MRIKEQQVIFLEKLNNESSLHFFLIRNNLLKQYIEVSFESL